MNSIPIFDCLTHPSLDGSWIHSRWDGLNSFEGLRKKMSSADVRWAFAVSMGTVDGWNVGAYPSECGQPGPKLFPVAYLDPDTPPNFKSLCEQGFVGVKIHPRKSRIRFDDKRLPDWISAAQEAACLAAFTATYLARDVARVEGFPSSISQAVRCTNSLAASIFTTISAINCCTI